ncbi:MAG TPA: hypothetical protein VFN35_20000 [Ktedonobacteraceae bacterium]|nr:hypothetical protein [Ktedonobacteraceae bacterium]
MTMDMSRYPPGWRKMSKVIRRIAGWKCEWCGGGDATPLPSGRNGKVFLTVAHIGTPYADGRPSDKHDKYDVRRENLRALCPGCHLRYDIDEHVEHARETRQRKKREAVQTAIEAGQLELFPGENECRAFVLV